MTSASRTVYLVAQRGAPAIPGVATTVEPLVWPAKSAADISDYTVDCTEFLADAGSDTITDGSVTISTAPTDLTFSNAVLTPTTLTWHFAAGTAGVTYRVTIEFSTAGGLTEQRTVLLPVVSL
jgi:hypothetical protein